MPGSRVNKSAEPNVREEEEAGPLGRAGPRQEGTKTEPAPPTSSFVCSPALQSLNLRVAQPLILLQTPPRACPGSCQNRSPRSIFAKSWQRGKTELIRVTTAASSLPARIKDEPRSQARGQAERSGRAKAA